MLASIPAGMVNHKAADLGIPNRFKLNSSRSRTFSCDWFWHFSRLNGRATFFRNADKADIDRAPIAAAQASAARRAAARSRPGGDYHHVDDMRAQSRAQRGSWSAPWSALGAAGCSSTRSSRLAGARRAIEFTISPKFQAGAFAFDRQCDSSATAIRQRPPCQQAWMP